jgi:hypothetical protein
MTDDQSNFAEMVYPMGLTIAVVGFLLTVIANGDAG